jgi:hypothetical protein
MAGRDLRAAAGVSFPAERAAPMVLPGFFSKKGVCRREKRAEKPEWLPPLSSDQTFFCATSRAK